MASLKVVFFKSLFFRIASILLIQTYFVADEYWQSLEPAHFLVFGFGYLTWEYNECIRSWTYPFLFVILFKILSILHIDYQVCVVYLPRFLQAAFTAAADCCFYKLGRNCGVSSGYIWSSIVFDWFSFYCGSRTLINTFESNLVCYGLACIQKDLLYFEKTSLVQLISFLIFVCLICFVRPTACLIWGPFCLLQFLQYDKKISYFMSFLAVGVLLALTLVALDSYLYGSFVLSPWNFISANILKDISSFYGSHPYHWYFTQGVPVVMGVQIIPFLLQAWDSVKLIISRWRIGVDFNSFLTISVASALFVYSLVPHKEFRFILPIVPMMKLLAVQKFPLIFRGVMGKYFQWALVLGFVIPVLLFGLLHLRASLAIMDHLSTTEVNENTFLLFLTPCHATPLYSHLHINVPVRFLTCEPPLSPDHQDESYIFFSNPKKWLTEYFLYNKPSHIVLFDSMAKLLSDELLFHNYFHNLSFFHTVFPEGRVGSYLELYKLNE